MTIQVTLFFTFVSILTLGEIAIGITSLPDSSTEFTISDGRILLEAHVSGNNVKPCKLSTDSKQIEKLLKSLPKTEQIGKKKCTISFPFFWITLYCGFFFQYFIFLKIAGTFCKNWQKMTLYNRVSYFFSFIGEYAIQEMFERCLRYMISRNKREDDDNKSTMPFAPEKTGQPAGPGASGIGIFPGTKWCGLGNEADTYADLGCYFFFNSELISYIFAVWPHLILLKCQYLCEQIYIFCCSAELIFNDSRRFHFIF